VEKDVALIRRDQAQVGKEVAAIRQNQVRRFRPYLSLSESDEIAIDRSK
jgi:hypothetical protein